MGVEIIISTKPKNDFNNKFNKTQKFLFILILGAGQRRLTGSRLKATTSVCNRANRLF